MFLDEFEEEDLDTVRKKTDRSNYILAFVIMAAAVVSTVCMIIPVSDYIKENELMRTEFHIVSIMKNIDFTESIRIMLIADCAFAVISIIILLKKIYDSSELLRETLSRSNSEKLFDRDREYVSINIKLMILGAISVAVMWDVFGFVILIIARLVVIGISAVGNLFSYDKFMDFARIIQNVIPIVGLIYGGVKGAFSDKDNFVDFLKSL